jgi:hypothetical protein
VEVTLVGGVLDPEVLTGASSLTSVECLPVVQGGMVRNSSKVRTLGGTVLVRPFRVHGLG